MNIQSLFKSETVCTMDDDIIKWPDGTWCFRDQHHEMSHMSDDYVVIKVGTDEWDQLAHNS